MILQHGYKVTGHHPLHSNVFQVYCRKNNCPCTLCYAFTHTSIDSSLESQQGFYYHTFELFSQIFGNITSHASLNKIFTITLFSPCHKYLAISHVTPHSARFLLSHFLAFVTNIWQYHIVKIRCCIWHNSLTFRNRQSPSVYKGT